MDIDEIRKKQDEIAKKIDQIRKAHEEELKYRERKLEKLNKYLAIVKITNYSSVKEFVDCDGNLHPLKEGKIIIIPLPNALPLVNACIGVILAIFPRNKPIPKLKLCPHCRLSSKTVTLFETHVFSKEVVFHEICPYCGKILKTQSYNTSCTTRK